MDVFIDPICGSDELRWQSIMTTMDGCDPESVRSDVVCPETKSSRKRKSSFFVSQMDEYRRRLTEK
jgi:hypothetical protein